MMKHFIRSANIYKLCILCAFKFEKKKHTKDLDSCTVDRTHLECKVQQMNILAWKKSLKSLFFKNFKVSKVRNITVLTICYSGDRNTCIL